MAQLFVHTQGLGMNVAYALSAPLKSAWNPTTFRFSSVGLPDWCSQPLTKTGRVRVLLRFLQVCIDTLRRTCVLKSTALADGVHGEAERALRSLTRD